MTDSKIFTLDNARDILRAIPHILGFHPVRSVVFLWLSGNRLVLGQRVDLLTADDLEPASRALWLEAVWAPAQAVNAESVVITFFVDSVDELSSSANSELDTDLLSDLLAQAPVRVIDVLFSAPDGWRDSYGVRHSWDPEDPRAERLLTEYFGYEPQIAREALSLDPVAPIRPPSRRAPGLAVRIRTVSLLVAAERGTLSETEVATIARGLRDVTCRDHALALMLDHSPRALARAWDDVVIRLPWTWAAPLATLTALAHWLSGDGARANIALERALADDPSYALAQLVESLVVNAVHPQQVRVWLEELRPRDARAS